MSNPIRGRYGMAVAPHALASQSALAVLREGGNAIEAMVAAAATIAVVYPHMNGLGGDSFWLVGIPQAGTGLHVTGIDASGAAARGVRRADYAGAIPFRGGTAALTVAGTLSGWEMALDISRERLGGRLPLSRLLADAMDYARDGFPVTDSQYRSTSAKRAELASVSGFADAFMPGGNIPEPGTLFRQPRLGATLEELVREGLGSFYHGDLAQSMARDLKAAGSPLVLDDLHAHAALQCAPLELQHSHGRIFNMPPPTQGLVSLMILGLADRLGLGALDHLGPDYIHLLVEAVKKAFQVRDRHLTDPAHMTAMPESFLAPGVLDEIASSLDMDAAAPFGSGLGPADTVWMGVVDRQGVSVSMIQSIYHEFGAGIVLPESGVQWQNRGASFSLDPGHINVLAPGKKPFHTLNPAMASLTDGRTIVYGAMGGDGQPQSQSAVFTRTAVLGMNPQDAVEAPRWLLGRTWGQSSDTLKLEGRFPDATVDALRARGHDVEVYPAYDETFGHAGCIVRDPDGGLSGGADPRSDGSVAAY